MGGAHSQAVAEAPSQEVLEAPSQDVVEVLAPPETSPTSAVGGHELEEPRYPNRKDALARGAEDDSGTEHAATIAAPRPGGGRPRARFHEAGGKKRSYPARVSVAWTPEIPAGFSVPAVFIHGNKPEQVQKKAGADPKSVPICIPLWPIYTLNVRNNSAQLSGLQFLHINQKEHWCRAIQKVAQINIDSGLGALDETQRLIKDAIKSSRKAGGVVKDPEDDASDGDSSGEEWSVRSRSFKRMPLLKVRVLDHVLTVANIMRPLALELTDASKTFIRDAVVPSILKARSQSVTVADTGTPAPFNFSGQDKLHFPGRVLWAPTTFSYELLLSGKGTTKLDKSSTTTDLEGKPLKVPAGLKGSDFQAARKRICHLACLAWNQRDRSTRPRFFPGEGRDREAEGTAE